MDRAIASPLSPFAPVSTIRPDDGSGTAVENTVHVADTEFTGCRASSDQNNNLALGDAAGNAMIANILHRES